MHCQRNVWRDMSRIQPYKLRNFSDCIYFLVSGFINVSDSAIIILLIFSNHCKTMSTRGMNGSNTKPYNYEQIDTQQIEDKFLIYFKSHPLHNPTYSYTHKHDERNIKLEVYNYYPFLLIILYSPLWLVVWPCMCCCDTIFGSGEMEVSYKELMYRCIVTFIYHIITFVCIIATIGYNQNSIIIHSLVFIYCIIIYVLIIRTQYCIQQFLKANPNNLPERTVAIGVDFRKNENYLEYYRIDIDIKWICCNPNIELKTKSEAINVEITSENLKEYRAHHIKQRDGSFSDLIYSSIGVRLDGHQIMYGNRCSASFDKDFIKNEIKQIVNTYEYATTTLKPQYFNYKSDLLVWGYVKFIDAKYENFIVPSDIIDLILDFYCYD